MLIIDDEAIVRKGIKETINWQAEGIEIVGEAKNGIEGYDKVLELEPDIVLSDIKMPGMDGVELAKKIDALEKDIAIVILSGYQDFAFAKGALENGAIEYLLKPIDNTELVASVLRAIVKVETLRKLKQESKTFSETKSLIVDQFLTELFFGKGDLDPLFGQINRDLGIKLPDTGIAIHVRLDDPDVIADNLWLEALSDLEKDIRYELGSINILSHIKDKELAILLPETECVEKKLASAIQNYAAKHAETISIGFSEIYANQESIRQAIENARMNSGKKLFPFFNSLIGPDPDRGMLKPIVHDAMQYIANNYQSNLTVKIVADALYVSESYLLHTFKENVKRTFNECLTAYRIMMAKKLLQNSSVRVYEVAEKVGYYDVKYFSQIFRKKVGMTPSDYHQLMERKQS